MQALRTPGCRTRSKNRPRGFSKKASSSKASTGLSFSEKLRSHPEIVDDFFGRSWLVAFAGEEAAASLKRPLEVQRVIALRRRLAEIYHARIQQLDPGLNVDPARRDTRDIRKRFVVPNVDPANPFHEPSLEPEDWPTEPPGQNDHAWDFDEYSDPGKPAGYFARPPSEPSETPSVTFERLAAAERVRAAALGRARLGQEYGSAVPRARPGAHTGTVPRGP